MRQSSSPQNGTDEQTTLDERTRAQGRDESPGGRGLLKGATAALLGVAGLGALGGTASAGGNTNHLLVFGDGPEKHTYEIVMKSGGSIQKGIHAGPNDSVSYSNNRADGEIWQWNLDSYTYTGEIESVTLDGSLSVQVPDGAFSSATKIHVDGQSSGRHDFEIDTHSADIDLVSGTTESSDNDEGGWWSERTGTNDRIDGMVKNTYHDSYSLGSGDPIQHLAVSDGNVRFSR